MHQFMWVSLIDSMILRSTGGRDAAEYLLQYLGLSTLKTGQNQLQHLCRASLDDEHSDEPAAVIELFPNKVINLYPQDAGLTYEVALFAHLAQTAVKAAYQRERLKSDAMIDQLTGLLNRRGWDYHISSLDKLVGVVAFLDVDQFKIVNQNLGYRLADEKLAAIGKHLRTAFRSDDCVCRWGGDEFLAFFESMDSKNVTRRLITLLTKIKSQEGISITFGLAEVDSIDVNGAITTAIEVAERSMAKRATRAS
jgi:diguanylate cyclase (GGDEF)-like protein